MRRAVAKYWLLAGLLAAICAFAGCGILCPRTFTYFEFQYEYRIHEGMTLDKVEDFLGKGTKRKTTVQTRDGPVIDGDEYYLWQRGHLDIWVGVRDGKVTGKYFWAPSL